jgi:hypothetical protein
MHNDSLEMLVRMMKARFPEVELKDMEFYLKENQLKPESSLQSQSVNGQVPVLVIPADAVEASFPTLLVLTTRSSCWGIHPNGSHLFPLYLRIHYEVGTSRDILIETDPNELISTIKCCLPNLNQTDRTSSRLMIDQNSLDESKTVADYGLTSGSRLRLAFLPNK